MVYIYIYSFIYNFWFAHIIEKVNKSPIGLIFVSFKVKIQIRLG